MKVNIVGRGAFGSFLAELLPTAGFELDENAFVTILAVPISAYEEVGRKYSGRHLVNVCSVQSTTTDILRKITGRVTSIHPLFGPRTPVEKRFSLLTHECNHQAEEDFIVRFERISVISALSLKAHDRLMARTHLAAVKVAQFAKPFIKKSDDVIDEFIPNSFRLLRDFVKTLDDMPAGTLESILANPYSDFHSQT